MSQPVSARIRAKTVQIMKLTSTLVLFASFHHYPQIRSYLIEFPWLIDVLFEALLRRPGAIALTTATDQICIQYYLSTMSSLSPEFSIRGPRIFEICKTYPP